MCLFKCKHLLQLKEYPVAVQRSDQMHRPGCQTDMGANTNSSMYQLCDLRQFT